MGIKKKKKVYRSTLILLILGSLLLGNCDNDLKLAKAIPNNEFPVLQNDALGLKAAKNFLDATLADTLLLHCTKNVSPNQHANFKAHIDWGTAEKTKAVRMQNMVIVADCTPNWNIKHKSKVLLQKINGKTKVYIITVVPIEKDVEGKIKKQKVFVHSIHGEFKKGYYLYNYHQYKTFKLTKPSHKIKKHPNDLAFWINAPIMFINNTLQSTIYPNWTLEQWQKNASTEVTENNNGTYTSNQIPMPFSCDIQYESVISGISILLAKEEVIYETNTTKAIIDQAVPLKEFWTRQYLDSFANVPLNTKLEVLGIDSAQQRHFTPKHKAIADILNKANAEKYHYTKQSNFKNKVPYYAQQLNKHLLRLAKENKLHVLDAPFKVFLKQFTKHSNIQIAERLGVKYIIQSQLNQQDTGLQNLWRAAISYINEGQQIANPFPAFGSFCDIVDGNLYMVEGDFLNINQSFTGIVPVFGQSNAATKVTKLVDKTTKRYNLTNVSLKLAEKILKHYGETYTKTVRKSNRIHNKIHETTIFKIANAKKVVHFGNRENTNYRLDDLIMEGEEAYHIIVAGLSNHELIQKAALGKQYFNLHHPDFKIPLPNNFKREKQKQYNAILTMAADKLLRKYGHDNDLCYKAAKALTQSAQQLFKKHKNADIKEIAATLLPIVDLLKI